MSTTRFPAVGHVYEVNFGSWVHHLHFESETMMTLTNADGPFEGTSETVEIAVTPIRPGVFLASWQEEDKTTVVHIEDYKKSVVYTNITERNGAFIRRRGTLKKLRVSACSSCLTSTVRPLWIDSLRSVHAYPNGRD